MNKSNFLAAFVALTFTTSAQTQVPSPDQGRTGHLITNPDWLKKPSPDETAAFWPKEATAKGLSQGKVLIKCRVALAGNLENCTIVSEEPRDVGFGHAALDMTKIIVMKPRTVDGRPEGSAFVTIPINFLQPSAPPPPIVIGGVKNPDWVRKLSTSEMMAYWPVKATETGLEKGDVSLACYVSREGKLSHCAVKSEAPANMGFGKAALNLTGLMLMPPKTADGGSQSGSVITFPIQFSKPHLSYLTHPQWIQTVSADPHQALFPDEAAKKGLKEGSATVDCVVGANGALSQCDVVRESVVGVGFGVMAQKIAETFIANPWTDDGLPADGAHVRLPIRLVLGESKADPEGAPTPVTKP